MAAPKLRVGFFNDFTGGLNLRSQRQDLSGNESPDCMDVDFDQRGGITLRRGYRNATTDSNMGTTATSGYLVGQYSLGTDKVWGVSSAGRLWTWDGATATHVATAITTNTTTEFVRGVAQGGRLYFSNAYNGGTTLIMRYWNDAAFTTLGNTANNNYTAPTTGNMPLARLIQDHMGYMWWADTVEAGQRNRSRVRFSHFLQPEDFATNDYFDIEVDDSSDQITALLPFRGALLVFKKRSVYAIYGTTRDDFVVERITATAGAWSQEAVTSSEGAVYWWSPDGEVFAYDGSKVFPIGNKISILVNLGTVSPGNDHRLLWAEKRLYLSILNNDTTRILYVFDPSVGQGAWTRYNLQVTSMVWWRRVSGVNGIMWRVLGKAGIQDFNITSQVQDYDGTTSVSIPGYYRTAWFSADNTALMKRWKRLQITCSCGDAATMNVNVYQDFNESTVVKTMLSPINPVAGGLIWGASTWGTGLWGGGDPIYDFDRMQSIGRSHSVSLKFTVTDHVSTWTMDSYAIPYLEKGYR